ncbi:MAG TPA: hypothetical protein VHP33_15960 [Polyangiaceae bacterium]|nr:hypothetical protein [Polyangiaceae bacterium]
MSNRGAMTWGVQGLLVLAGLAAGLATAAGCADDDAVPASGGTGGAGAGGEGGSGTAGKAVSHGGAGAGGEATCDCGTDVNVATIPLACACAAGLCTTFAEDLATYLRGQLLAEPNYVLLGTCDDGYRTLSHEEATEQVRKRTYAADGRMVYDYFGGYGGPEMPKACGFTDHLSLGSSTVGEDPSKNCSYCLVTASDEPVDDGAGGAGGAGGGASGSPYYPQSLTAPCNAALLE